MDTTTNQSPQNSSVGQWHEAGHQVIAASEITVSLKYGDTELSCKLIRPVYQGASSHEEYVKNSQPVREYETRMQSLLTLLRMLALIQRVEQSLSTNTGSADQTTRSDKPSESPRTESQS